MFFAGIGEFVLGEWYNLSTNFFFLFLCFLSSTNFSFYFVGMFFAGWWICLVDWYNWSTSSFYQLFYFFIFFTNFSFFFVGIFFAGIARSLWDWYNLSTSSLFCFFRQLTFLSFLEVQSGSWNDTLGLVNLGLVRIVIISNYIRYSNLSLGLFYWVAQDSLFVIMM